MLFGGEFVTEVLAKVGNCVAKCLLVGLFLVAKCLLKVQSKFIKNSGEYLLQLKGGRQ